MENKVKVQNPLTIIAIFAGIAEIAGTAVLLGLSYEIQRIFVWFVMLFPCGLVLLFFLVLLFNHGVLYAPSDFVDEKNFIGILEKSKKIDKELKDATSILEETAEKLKLTVQTNKDPNGINLQELKGKLDEVINKVESAKQNNISNGIENYSGKLISKSQRSFQKSILNALAQSGSEGLTRKQLSSIIGLNLLFVTNYLEQLIEDGLIVKENDKYKLFV